jgi:hypothetical protein
MYHRIACAKAGCEYPPYAITGDFLCLEHLVDLRDRFGWERGGDVCGVSGYDFEYDSKAHVDQLFDGPHLYEAIDHEIL